MKLYSTLIPYLLLVSFYTGQINKLDIEKIDVINKSPYAGVAVPLVGVYDTDKYKKENFEKSINVLKDKSKKHIWPWIFFNRFIGYEEGESSHDPHVLAGIQYFHNIKGMDIYNEVGALDDFYEIWRIALKAAKELGSPGILIDHEAYNDYKNYDLSHISKQLGKSEKEVKSRLKLIGAELVNITEKEYPKAILWFLSTDFGFSENYINPSIEDGYRTITYIILGMLQRARELKSELKFVEGGEISLGLLGYCYLSLEDLEETTRKRKEQYKAMLATYPNFYLGGTIAPWDDIHSKKDWMTKGKCGKSKLSNIKDFKPLYQHLFSCYQYVWIYAAKAANYNPYDANLSYKYNTIIDEIINQK